MGTLSKIESLLERGEHAAALEAVCTVWRETRDARLAAVAEALAARCAKSVEALPEKPVAGHHEAWLARAPKASAAELAVLLTTMASHKAPMALERIEKLSAQAPSPLVAGALTRLVLAPPFQSTGGRPFWKRLFATLPEHADPRTVEQLKPCVGAFAQRLGAATIGEIFEDGVRAALASLQTALASLHRPLGGDDLAALSRLEAALATPARAPSAASGSEEQLLAAVLERPDDDGPRQVLSDFLLEKGDPRGEFIALQFKRRTGGLAPKDEAREKALINKHAADWLGDFANFTLKKSLRFERGFLSACEYFAKKKSDADRAVGHRLWATVERIDGPVPIEVLTGSPLRALRELGPSPDKIAYSATSAIVGLEAVAAMAARGPLPRLESICCWADHDKAEAAKKTLCTCEVPGLPALRELDLRGFTHDARWLWASPLARQLTRVTLPAFESGASWSYGRKDDHNWGPTCLAVLLADLEAASCRIREVCMLVGGALVTLSFAAEGKPVAIVELEKKPMLPYHGFVPSTALAQTFGEIPAGRLARIELRPKEGFDHAPILEAAQKVAEVKVG